VIDAADGGALDGIAIDAQGHIWCGYGSNGRVPSAGLDGVRVYEATGQAIGHIHLPERCANLCFGGAKMNRLFMASSHSLYALHVNTRGA
jgi:gluconolactonase